MILAISNCALVLIGLFGLKQIFILNQNNYLDKIRILLQLEQTIYEHHYKVFTLLNVLREEEINKNVDKEKVLKLSIEIETSKEILLNVIDRICYLILSNKMHNIKWKEEYEDMIHEVYTKFELEGEEKYNNIRKVEKMWKNQKNHKYHICINVITQNGVKSKCFFNK